MWAKAVSKTGLGCPNWIYYQKFQSIIHKNYSNFERTFNPDSSISGNQYELEESTTIRKFPPPPPPKNVQKDSPQSPASSLQDEQEVKSA